MTNVWTSLDRVMIMLTKTVHCQIYMLLHRTHHQFQCHLSTATSKIACEKKEETLHLFFVSQHMDAHLPQGPIHILSERAGGSYMNMHTLYI
jgi:hypothetical protein